MTDEPSAGDDQSIQIGQDAIGNAIISGNGNVVIFQPAATGASAQESPISEIGPNPYKYPVFTNFGAIQLIQVINENDRLLEKQDFTQPTFAVHSLHDTAALIKGIGDLFRAHDGTAIGIVLEPPDVDDLVHRADITGEVTDQFVAGTEPFP